MDLIATITLKGNLFDGKAPAIVRAQLVAYMYEATAFLEEKVKANLPTDLDGLSRGVGVYGNAGGLRSTIHGEPTDVNGTTIKGVVAHESIYGDIIEKGREAGKTMPPSGTLLRWMEVKLGMSKKEALSKEFIIRRKIGQKGFPGIHMFERAFNEGFNQLTEMADKYGFQISRAL